MLSKKCLICNEQFFKKQNRSLISWNNDAKFCSRKCNNNSKIGHTPWNKGLKGFQIAWNKGVPGLKGENNGAWRGTDDKYWRNKARERDQYVCQGCGLNEPDILEVDHIKPKSKFPELRYVLENLITLCPNCHKRKTIKELKSKRL